jgi:DNA mismatch repair protein MSH2
LVIHELTLRNQTEWFDSLTEGYVQCVLPTGSVANQQDYYSAHGADAILIAHQVYKTTNVIKYLGSAPAHPPKPNSAITAKGLPSVTISMALTKAFLREALTTKQMRVEIYEPIEGQGGRKNNTAWKISKEASPGNIGALEDLLFDRDDLVSNAVSMAIRVTMKDGVRTVGCAFVDVQEKTVGVSQFDETENFSNTEVSFESCIENDQADKTTVVADPAGYQGMPDTSG